MRFDKYEKLGAYHFDWYDDPNWAWYKECVDRCVDFCKDCTMDLGGGDGLVSKKIMERYKDVSSTVFDNDQTALQIVRDRKGYTQTIDLNDSWCFERLKGDHYDYACCLNTIEHLETPDGVLNLIRYSVDKGAIIITDKAAPNPGRYHEHEYTKDELIEVFKEFDPSYFEINSTEFGKPITFIGVEISKDA